MSKENPEENDPILPPNFYAQSDKSTEQTTQINHYLNTAIGYKKFETGADWKRSITFLILFIFLYVALGTSLTMDLPSTASGHKSIEYALRSIPVLIAFSGYFIAVLFIFIARTGARRINGWDKIIAELEERHPGNVIKFSSPEGSGTDNYSLTSINVVLSLFICLTWLVIYNYLTFTTSGVFGSVISLFISTLVYVILDIQILKPFKHAAEADKSPDDQAEQ